MPVTSVEKNPESLTMTVVADFGVPVRRLWDAYVDPRQIEKFWGPPGWPATFTRHDVAPGGRSDYYMTGPDGEKSAGFWEFLSVDPLRSFEVRDGFATDDGSPNPDMPSMRMVFTFEETDQGSRLTTTTRFNSVEELEQLVGMGMEEGMRAAMGQIDDVLADLASFAAGRGTETQILSDTLVRVSRVIRGDIEQVWRAHQEPELLQRWQLGPDGWTMPVCEVADKVGETYRYEWESVDGENRFGFTGELLESEPPHRMVTTERMIGMEGPGVVNEMTLTPVEGGTLLSLVIAYPNAELRDTVLATGMTDGMERSYARLESEVLAPA
ncbi:ATPase [Aeromicrobium phragmitis]|uniref:ATPase n=1 Tax=Aeromicrobium phragmitis TaxID=2478914 RepID=A0A3L8PS21_9ACTN|nr:SRPBCC family protein [Aeromicrobium phragmitis]RLV56762.1 ATPase [Aeromicrobium phragmitis]